MPMFPDSGVPAGEARNTVDVNTVTPCDELWYSTSRCTPRFDPAAANAMLAEDMNLIMRGEVVYDCNSLTNIERAVRYIVQRGMARACNLAGGPTNYTASLDPKATRYNNFMTLTIVPNVDNVGYVTLNIDGVGQVWLLRNDRQHLERQDLRAGIPAIIACVNNTWYMVGLASSQVPLLVKGAIDAWIRTDGNDTTGDGTANTPDKAFRTIAGCWAALGSRFAATPSFSINMRLGIPGDYVGALIGPFGGVVTLSGDMANRAAYRIHAYYTIPSAGDGRGYGNTLSATGCNFQIYGVTFLMNIVPQYANWVCGAVQGANVMLVNCRIEILNNSSVTNVFHVSEGSEIATTEGTMDVEGHGCTIGHFVSVSTNSRFIAARLLVGMTSYWTVQNMIAQYACVSVGGVSLCYWGGVTNLAIGNVIGTQYGVQENSILSQGGKPLLGTVAGAVSSGGQFIP